MESSLQAVMLFHNYQATRPYFPAPGPGATAAFYKAASPTLPPVRKKDKDDDDPDQDKDDDKEKEKEDGEEHK